MESYEIMIFTMLDLLTFLIILQISISLITKKAFLSFIY